MWSDIGRADQVSIHQHVTGTTIGHRSRDGHRGVDRRPVITRSTTPRDLIDDHHCPQRGTPILCGALRWDPTPEQKQAVTRNRNIRVVTEDPGRFAEAMDLPTRRVP